MFLYGQMSYVRHLRMITFAQVWRVISVDYTVQPQSGMSNYYKNRIEEIKTNPDYDFVAESGRKYYKIVMVNNQRSVHAFIDKRTGEVYKPAGWQGPAKHVRYDLRLIKDREYVLENCDWAGGYLYMR